MSKRLSPQVLQEQNRTFEGTMGVSAQSSVLGFVPAFKNIRTGETRLSMTKDGSCSPVHILDGLPDEWVAKRDGNGHVVTVKDSVVAGFISNGCFYTREELAKTLRKRSTTSL
jgi:hypothetical protein